MNLLIHIANSIAQRRSLRSLLAFLHFSAAITVFAQPANDNPCNAVVLAPNLSCTNTPGTLAAATPIAARPAGAHKIALWSRSHDTHRAAEYRDLYDIDAVRTLGSSLKFCLIAAGEADLYPRHGTTMEWDTAAGQAVLQAAGGSVRELSGAPLLYGKAADGFRNPSFVARGR